MSASTARSGRKVAVLGPIPQDHIVTHRGEVLDKYGCALYTVAALSSLLGEEDTVYPIVNIRQQDEAPIKELLSQFSNVDLTGIRCESDRGDVIELIYTAENRRDETQTGFMHPIAPEHVEFVLDADMFVCVPITDYEVAQPTLAYIRQHSDGLIMLDCHGPTVALTTSGQRVPRLWIDRDPWLTNVDVIKMNLEEAGCSWFPPPGADPALLGAPLPTEQLPDFAAHCLERGVKAVCVTLDEEGCALYQLDDSGQVVEELVPRIQVDNVVDTTGCGDSFAAGMGFGYLDTRDFTAAAQYGNAMGAQRCSGKDLSVYLGLERTRAQIREAYGQQARV